MRPEFMHWVASADKDSSTDPLAKRRWDAADQFHANSGPILGMIFLRFTVPWLNLKAEC